MVDREADSRLLIATSAAAVAIVAVAFMVANMGHFDLGQGGDGLGPAANEVGALLSYILVAVLVLFGAYFILTRSRRAKAPAKGGPGKPRRGMSGFILLFAIVGALLIYSTLTDGNILKVAPENQEPSTPSQDGDSSSPFSAPGGMGGALLAVAFLIVLGVVAVFGGVKYIRHRPIRVSRAASALEARKAKAIMDQAVQDLIHAGEDPRSVIIRTYQRMSRLISGRLQDLPYLTPREMASVAELKFGWPSQPTEELTTLFEVAWYSDHPLTDAEKEGALRCLREISSSHRLREVGGVATNV